MSNDWPLTVLKVPRDATTNLEVLTLRPVAWEYLTFGHYLLAGLDRTEEKWRDFSLGYTLRMGRRVDEDELPRFVSENMSRVSMLAANVERVISAEAQAAAFGQPGEPGDPEMIAHMANRLIQLYEALLDWTEDFRSNAYPYESELGAMGARLARQPITAVREFAHRYVEQLEDALALLANDPGYAFNLSLALTFELEDGAADDLIAEVRRLVGR